MRRSSPIGGLGGIISTEDTGYQGPISEKEASLSARPGTAVEVSAAVRSGALESSSSPRVGSADVRDYRCSLVPAITGGGSERGRAVGGPALGDVLAIARTIDVDADRVHGESVEDRGGEGGVAQEAAPVAEPDI